MASHKNPAAVALARLRKGITEKPSAKKQAAARRAIGEINSRRAAAKQKQADAV